MKVDEIYSDEKRRSSLEASLGDGWTSDARVPTPHLDSLTGIVEGADTPRTIEWLRERLAPA